MEVEIKLDCCYDVRERKDILESGEFCVIVTVRCAEWNLHWFEGKSEVELKFTLAVFYIVRMMLNSICK